VGTDNQRGEIGFFPRIEIQNDIPMDLTSLGELVDLNFPPLLKLGLYILLYIKVSDRGQVRISFLGNL
jgi:hypothetical protein